MTSDHIGDMTLDELVSVIQREINHRLPLIDRARLNDFASKQDSRTVDDINESIKRRRRVPASGTPSTLELLREDRDR